MRESVREKEREKEREREREREREKERERQRELFLPPLCIDPCRSFGPFSGNPTF